MARLQLKISVPKPCSENWNAMTPQAQGRFCASCATTVVDFSQFTDKQLLEYFANTSGKTCGRFSISQLNRPVYAETQPQQNFIPRFLAAVALFLGISSQTQAQNYYDHPTPSGQVVEKKASEKENATKTVEKTPEKVNRDSLVISGRVLHSETKEPIPFATVYISDTKIGSNTDINGEFKIVLPDSFQLEEFTLVIPYVGYKTDKFVAKRSELPFSIEFMLVEDPSSIAFEMIGVISVKPTPGFYLRSFWWKTKNLFRRKEYEILED